MLAKCAESAALRKAFPLELSGLYTPEESDAMEEPAAPAPLPPERRLMEATSLPGNAKSWGGYGGLPLADCPTSVLTRFVGWVQEDASRTQRYALVASAAEEIVLRRKAAEEADAPAAEPDVPAAEAA